MIRKHCFFVWENVPNTSCCHFEKNLVETQKHSLKSVFFFDIRVDSELCGPFMHKMCHNLISKFIVNIVCNALCAMQQYGVVALSLPSFIHTYTTVFGRCDAFSSYINMNWILFRVRWLNLFKSKRNNKKKPSQINEFAIIFCPIIIILL